MGGTMTAQLYDRTGAAFELDHVIGDVAYVRPLVNVVDEYGQDLGLEAAEFLVSRPRDALFDAPPVQFLDAEISERRAELKSLVDDARRARMEEQAAIRKAKAELDTAKRQLAEWMSKHRVMMDLGKLLDGETLYPLSTKDAPYHSGPDIPAIPTMRNTRSISLKGGNFETGKPWVCKSSAEDTDGHPFKFFYTEEERAAAISAEFDRACDAFRRAPNFREDGKTYYSSALDFGKLMRWVETHPALSIPGDIIAMKAEADAQEIKARREKLVAELDALAKAESPERE